MRDDLMNDRLRLVPPRSRARTGALLVASGAGPARVPMGHPGGAGH
jgi:hypothetical protein